LLAALAGITSATAQSGGERRGAPPGQFDFYVLALSWSPGFCALGGAEKNRKQCNSDLGFVVHGLWPQYTSGYPSECATAATQPSRAALAATVGVYPDLGLARYEWRKHGTCSGLSPTDYFAAVRKAREAVVIPPAIAAMNQDATWTPIDLERAFVAANRGLRTDMMSVSCRRGVLSEIRICFTKDLRGFQTCPELDRRGCRGGSVKLPAP
jgi:ribonuclease T2